MRARLIFFGIVAIIGLVCFVEAVIFLLQGHNAEWVTLILAPISGICLAIVMNYANIFLSFNVSFVVKDGYVSLKISKS